MYRRRFSRSAIHIYHTAGSVLHIFRYLSVHYVIIDRNESSIGHLKMAGKFCKHYNIRKRSILMVSRDRSCINSMHTCNDFVRLFGSCATYGNVSSRKWRIMYAYWLAVNIQVNLKIGLTMVVCSMISIRLGRNQYDKNKSRICHKSRALISIYSSIYISYCNNSSYYK